MITGVWLIRSLAIFKVRCITVTAGQEKTFSDKMLQDACVFNIMQVGELAAKIIAQGIGCEHSEIEWRQMRGMRNRIVHDYEGISLGIVWDTIQYDFPILLNKLLAEV